MSNRTTANSGGAESKPAKASVRRRRFSADIDQLLDIVIRSVYSSKDVFLRELVSNAADAIEKRRFLALERGELAAEAPPKITVEVDEKNRTITVSDPGIGMDDKELVETLGSIAHSGARAFLEASREKTGEGQEGADLIGRFGIGFYAAFMVADEVVVRTRRADQKASWIWRSKGRGGFTVAPNSKTEAPVGTSVELHVTEEDETYLDSHRLRAILKAYSGHLSVPVELKTDKETTSVGEGKAIWRKKQAEVSDEDYKAFYGQLGFFGEGPERWLHLSLEGLYPFSALLYVPASRPPDLFSQNFEHRIKLYVKRVFIGDGGEVLPAYLRFLRGVVDSDDLPLSISREMLQQSKALASISKALTGRLLSEFAAIAKKEPEAWAAIWENFGAVLKEGFHLDSGRREKLLPLLRFRTTKSEGTGSAALRSLDDYIADKQDGQKAIYYLIGDKYENLEKSAQAEGFVAKGIEVILFDDPVDNLWLPRQDPFKDLPFKSVTQGVSDLDAPDDDAKGADDKAPSADGDDLQDSQIASLCAYASRVLGDRVKSVRPSKRLALSPVCFVAPDAGMDLNLDRLFARQAEGLAGSGHVKLRPVLEINPDHPLVRQMASAAQDADSEALVLFLYDLAGLSDGQVPADRQAFTQRLVGLALKSLNGEGGVASESPAKGEGHDT